MLVEAVHRLSGSASTRIILATSLTQIGWHDGTSPTCHTNQRCLAPGTRCYVSHSLEVHLTCKFPWMQTRNRIIHMHRFLPFLALTPGFHCSRCHGDSRGVAVRSCVYSCTCFVATRLPLIDGVILPMDCFEEICYPIFSFEKYCLIFNTWTQKTLAVFDALSSQPLSISAFFFISNFQKKFNRTGSMNGILKYYIYHKNQLIM